MLRGPKGRAKSAPEAGGDVWTWTASQFKELIVSWHVGDRTMHTGISFVSDLRRGWQQGSRALLHDLRD